jgi:hypothetical protein
MTLLILFLALMGGVGAASSVARRDVGGWTVATRTDAFTGEVRCDVFRREVSFERGAVVIRLGPRINTFDAAYRVDSGPLRRSRDDAMQLAAMGFRLSEDDLRNPSRGIVRIPNVNIGGANAVTVESRPFARPVVLSVAGLGAAVEAAKAAGCKMAA